MNASGRFAVSWTGDVYDSQTQMVQVFNAAGQPLGATVSLASAVNSGQQPGLAIDGAGNVTVAWTAAPDWNGSSTTAYDNAREIRVSRLSADGSLSDQFVVNTTTEGRQINPSVAATGDGFVVSWNGRGAGDDSGVFTQRYTTTAPLPAVGSAAYDAAVVEYLLSLSDDDEE